MGSPPPQPHEDRRPRSGDTLAFLFSDIEASTRRWESDREAMAENLTRHDELLRAAVAAHEGRVFAHTGDGLCSVFPIVSCAIAAALSAQRSLLAEDWGATGPLRVRMAIHAGAAESRGGNYVGPTLNRTARLLSTAHGSQVVCSQAAADLGWDELPKEITLLDLGEHRLADLARAERVYQVVHSDLPSAFPPLRSLDVHRHNLPVALTSFVGRERELAELETLLSSGRLLTLTGVGGVGKTRLALELATRCLGRFPHGVFLVDLTPLRDPGLVAFELAASLGLMVSGVSAAPGALEDRLCEHLEPRRALLLFDNCEHLVQAVASLVDVLLRRCPAVVVVATSRELLGVAGEVAWAVPSLSLPRAGATRHHELAASDAASLFSARAQLVKPGFALSAANATAVAEICYRLDGIPLALELACARLRLFSVEQVASHLDDAFRLLTGGARTALARHQTLRATMDWSYELLSPAEQAALRRLAVLPGSFDLEAAEAVVGDVEGEAAGAGADVLDLLAHLVDKSLVGVEGEGAEVRNRLLETVRQYGGEKLAQAGETEDTRRRHRDFYLARGERWRPWEKGGIPILGADDDSFRAALEWSLSADDADASMRLAAAQWVYWLYSGHELEGCAWLERSLATAPQPHTPARAACLIGLANLSLICGRGDREQAQGLFDEALSLAVELGDREAESVAQRFLAVAALAQGDADRAKGLADEALTVADASGLLLGAGWCHNTLGWVAMAQGNAREARAHFEQAVEAARQCEDPALGCHALAALAPLVAFSGEAELAVTLADQSVEAARRLRLRQLLVMTLVRSAEATILAGGGERAEEALREALRLLGELGAKRWVADTLEMTALAREARGHPASAAELLAACDALRQALGESSGAHRYISSKVLGCRHRVAEALGAQTYEEHLTRGKRFAVPEVISYALSQLGQSPRHEPAPSP